MKKWAQHPRYRCTRNSRYPNKRPVAQRQGYIVHAPSRRTAIIAMGKKFRRDRAGFTCQLSND